MLLPLIICQEVTGGTEFGQNYNVKYHSHHEGHAQKRLLARFACRIFKRKAARKFAMSKGTHVESVASTNDDDRVKDGFSIIVISRFLCRDIFHEIIELLKIGGIVCVHSFMSCNAKPKKIKDKVEEGELSKIFGPTHGMEVLRDTIYTQPNDGRKLSMFVAMKVHD